MDDANLIAEPHAAVAGLRVFVAEAASRGWTVNLSKTLVGCGYYLPPAERAAKRPYRAAAPCAVHCSLFHLLDL